MANQAAPPPGAAVDARGVPVIDPTMNVKALVDTERRRTDDLRKADHEHDKEIRNLERVHAKELRINESGRLDAILTNVRDTALATATAAEVRATTLADQATKSADALRAQVADTQQASTDALDRRFAPIQTSIEEIRKFQFETLGGKQQVVEHRAEVADLKPVLDAIASLSRRGDKADGQRDQIMTGQTKSRNTGMWIAIGVSFAAFLSAALFSAASIVVSIIVAVYLRSTP